MDVGCARTRSMARSLLVDNFVLNDIPNLCTDKCHPVLQLKNSSDVKQALSMFKKNELLSKIALDLFATLLLSVLAGLIPAGHEE